MHSKARQPDQLGIPYEAPVKVFKLESEPVGEQYQCVNEAANKMKMK